MTRSNNLARLVAGRRTRYRIGAVAAAAMAVGASPAGAQYGADPPLPPLPALQGTATPGAPATAAPGSPAPSQGVADAVGSGNAAPAAGTAGEVRDTGVGAPNVEVVSSERAQPVAVSGDLPFTGARIGMLAAIGAGLLVLGLGARRRSGLRSAKP